jgi:DNA-binding response OmpR family regulator
LIKFDPEKKKFVLAPELFGEFVRTRAASVLTEPGSGLSSLETALFEYLGKHKDRICSFDELAREVWKIKSTESNNDMELLRRRIQVTISRLRKKLQESFESDIVSIRDQGYRLVSM